MKSTSALEGGCERSAPNISAPQLASEGPTRSVIAVSRLDGIVCNYNAAVMAAHLAHRKMVAGLMIAAPATIWQLPSY
jgi:hypothetical protein